MSQLRIASINIERSKHLHRLAKFVSWYAPDVLCLQEVCQRDIPFIEDLLGNAVTYAPMCNHAAEVEMEPVGIALTAWGAMEDVTTEYYHGNPAHIQDIRFTSTKGHEHADNDSIANALISATYQGFRIATTHLNVTPAGLDADYQMVSAEKMLKLARAQSQRAGGLLLTGDFNAPRGRATFARINRDYTDGVPAHYTTSIDGSLHRAGQIPFMVDGLFHTPSYKLEDATLHTGVSDHCALTCTLSKN